MTPRARRARDVDLVLEFRSGDDSDGSKFRSLRKLCYAIVISYAIG
jgi:hypothetical protein